MCVWLAFSVILLCWTMFLWIQSQVFQNRSVPYNRVLRMGERGPVILHLSNFFIWSVDSIEGIQGIWAEAYFVIAINAVSTKKELETHANIENCQRLFHFKVSNSEALNPFRVLRRKLRTNRRGKNIPNYQWDPQKFELQHCIELSQALSFWFCQRHFRNDGLLSPSPNPIVSDQRFTSSSLRSVRKNALEFSS